MINKMGHSHTDLHVGKEAAKWQHRKASRVNPLFHLALDIGDRGYLERD